MGDVEVYCDSDEEVFFGPVTEKEKKIVENLRRRALCSGGSRLPTSAADSQDDEEGLHTLAMAAQMLSLSSCDNGDSQEAVTVCQSEKATQNEFHTILPPVNTITRGIVMNTNERNPLELDAVKFLSRHLPEQNHSQMDDFTRNRENISNVEVEYSNEDIKATDISAIDYKYNMLDVKENCVDWEDANEISKGEFGIKMSDNEEEMEKVERNLKVEEIIKFLADEDSQSKVKVLNEASEATEQLEVVVDGVTDSKVRVFTSFDDVTVCGIGNNQLSHLNREDTLGQIDTCESLGTNVTNVILEIPKMEISLKGVKTEIPKMEITLEGVDAVIPEMEIGWEGLKAEIPEMEVGWEGVKAEVPEVEIPLQGVKAEIPEVEIPLQGVKAEIPEVEIPLEGVKAEIPEADISLEEFKDKEKECEKVNEGSDDKTLLEKKESEDKDVHQLGSLAHCIENMEPFRGSFAKVPTPSDSIRKPPTGSSLKNPSSNCKRTPKVTPGMERRPGTPRVIRTPNTSAELGKHPSSSRPLRPLQSPALDATSFRSCARSLMQEANPPQAVGTAFKTPNAKVKSAVGSKIPHLSLISPSSNKNKKFAGIVSPVSRYIHSKPVVLIANKKPPAGHAMTQTTNLTIVDENKSPKTSDTMTQKSLPDILGERGGAESVCETNCSTLPEVNFKSALPLKIFSPNPSPKTPKSGKTAIVTKHLGHVKISSSGDGRKMPPLPYECRESMIPDGEVSLLLSKEVELHCPAVLRN